MDPLSPPRWLALFERSPGRRAVLKDPHGLAADLRVARPEVGPGSKMTHPRHRSSLKPATRTPCRIDAVLSRDG